MGYNKLVSRGNKGSCHGEERFRVPRLLTARNSGVFKVMSRWRFSCSQALHALKKLTRRRSIRRNGSSGRGLIGCQDQQNNRRAEYCKFMSSCAWSSSFHAEAIADCLEFIKRSSVSVDPGGSPIDDV